MALKNCSSHIDINDTLEPYIPILSHNRSSRVTVDSKACLNPNLYESMGAIEGRRCPPCGFPLLCDVFRTVIPSWWSSTPLRFSILRLKRQFVHRLCEAHDRPRKTDQRFYIHGCIRVAWVFSTEWTVPAIVTTTVTVTGTAKFQIDLATRSWEQLEVV